MPPAPFVYKNASVKIGPVASAVDISGWVRSVVVDIVTDAVESTPMGSLAHTQIAGLQSSTITIECNADFAASATYSVLIAELAQGDTEIQVKPVATTISATNPEFRMSGGWMGNLPVVNATAVGDLASFSVTVTGYVSQVTTP
jgi:hypothetical protein